MNTDLKKTLGVMGAFAGILLILFYFFGTNRNITSLIMGIGGTFGGISLATNFFNKKENEK